MSVFQDNPLYTGVLNPGLFNTTPSYTFRLILETIFNGFGTGSIALGGAAAYNRGEI
jgi:hypothetical protein